MTITLSNYIIGSGQPAGTVVGEFSGTIPSTGTQIHWFSVNEGSNYFDTLYSITSDPAHLLKLIVKEGTPDGVYNISINAYDVNSNGGQSYPFTISVGAVGPKRWEVPMAFYSGMDSMGGINFYNLYGIKSITIETSDGLPPAIDGSNLTSNTKVVLDGVNSVPHFGNQTEFVLSYILTNYTGATVPTTEGETLTLTQLNDMFALCTHPDFNVSGAFQIWWAKYPDRVDGSFGYLDQTGAVFGSQFNIPPGFNFIAHEPAEQGTSKTWQAGESLISNLISSGLTGLETIRLTTIDGLAPNGFTNNMDPLKSYIKVSGTKYYLTTVHPDQWNGIPTFTGPTNEDLLLFDTFTCKDMTGNNFISIGSSWMNPNQLYFKVSTNGTMVEAPILLNPWNTADGTFTFVPAEGVEITEFSSINGKVVASVTVDPRENEVSYNSGSALPTGSVVKNTVTGQKFLKIEGGKTAFTAIPVTPLPEWGWDSSANDDWQTLQSF